MQTKISKANAHFAALNLVIPLKRFKEIYKMSINHEDLDVDFILQHCNSEIFMSEGNEETESKSYRRRRF